MTFHMNTLSDDEIASRLNALKIELIEADIRVLFGKLGTISRIHDPKVTVCGWRILGGFPLRRDLLPVDCSLDTESERHREHRRSIIVALRAAYDSRRV